MSQLGATLLVCMERKVLRVYLDNHGNPTAGIGHLLSSEQERKRFPVGSSITEVQCRTWFDQDLGRVDTVIRSAGLDLNENQLAAVESLLFNAGVGMLLGKAPRLTRALRAQDWATAAHEFLDICHARNQDGTVVVDKGLAARRRMESVLFLRPVTDEPVTWAQVRFLGTEATKEGYTEGGAAQAAARPAPNPVRDPRIGRRG